MALNLGYGLKVDFLPGLLMALLGVFVVSRIMKLLNGQRAVSYLPGMRIPFEPVELPGVALPTTWWNPGVNFIWLWRSHFYKHFQSENVSFVPFLFGSPTICTSNLDVIRQLVAGGGQKTSFGKPPIAGQGLLLWGMNIITAEGETWRKHRRIIGPAFDNDLYQMVWSETLVTYHEMISEDGWATKNTVEVPVVQKLTFKLALLIIARCGFGLPFNWSAPLTAPNGGMTIQEAMNNVGDTILLAIFMPKWLLWLPFRKFREMQAAREQVMAFMRTQALSRKKEIRGQGADESDRKDIFTMLVRANETEEGKLQLDDDELIGNTFAMLFAGHETTARTLAATIGFLSLHEDIQKEVREQIYSVVGYDTDPVFEEYAKLDKVLAVFYEAIRMFPPAYVLLREAREDTIVKIPNPVGVEGSTTVPIQKGVTFLIDMVGTQYNPRYFDEPEKYKPSRWYGASNESEAFSLFSVGPRACVGRKFATVEAVAFLTMLLRDWEIEPILRQGETKPEWRDRVLDAKLAFTLGVKDVPVKFTKRVKRG